MHSLLRIVCVAVAVVIASYVHAAEKIMMMTIDFVGDWCFSDLNNNTASYRLPSWIEGGHCTKILSIQKWGFYGDGWLYAGGWHCEPVKMRLSKDVAPSGTTYIALITARCQPDGPVGAGVLKTFEFTRYKGNLDVTPK
jgi:hypothetical protein